MQKNAALPAEGRSRKLHNTLVYVRQHWQLSNLQAATMILYTPQACDGIRFEAEGNVPVDVEKYDLAFDKE